MPRQLLCTQRTVPVRDHARYHASWAELAGAARLAGVNAWLFSDSTDGTRFLEFLEWTGAGEGSEGATIDDDSLARSRAALDARFGSGTGTAWQEVRLQ